MRKRHTLAGLAFGAAIVAVGPALPVAAQDLDCDSPGVGTNIPVPGEDPNGFDRDDDGIGCEADGSDAAPPTTTAPTPPTPDRHELAYTGAGTAASAVAGLALAGGGGAALLAARHHRPRHMARRRRG